MKNATVPDHIQKLVVLGDPHGDLAGVQEAYRIEDGAGTFFCCVGDVVGYADGPTSSRLCEFLIKKGTPTVEGNHEDWVSKSGKLAVFQGNKARLSEDAFRWVRSLPELICLARGDGRQLAVLAHSIRRGGWDWIDEDNASQFVKELGSPRVVLVGHSHRPKFITVDSRGRATRQPFDYREAESMETPIPRTGTLLIDAGSIARPEATEVTGDARRHDGSRFGTYASLDLTARLASLKRVLKGDQGFDG